MIKKILIFVAVTSILLAVVLWFGQRPILEWVKKNPDLYRVLQKGNAKFKSITNQTNSLGDLNKNESMTEAHLVIDYNKSLGQFNKFWRGFGIDSFNNGILLPFNYEFLKTAGQSKDDSQLFTHVNVKGIFADPPNNKVNDIGGHVYKENADGKVEYNWKIVDKVFDSILENNLKPVISLSYMPEDLASNVNKKNPWNHAVVSPPTDYNKWRDLVYATIEHLQDRYGTDEIKDWYFEVWNEPDMPQFFWKKHPDRKRYPKRGDNLEYFKLYDYTIDGAIDAEPDLQIGGPAIAGDIFLFINEWFSHCLNAKNYKTGKTGTRIDFLSRHCYGNIENRILPGIMQFVGKSKENGLEIFNRSKFLISEAGPSTVPKKWLNTRYVAAWIVKLIDGICYLGDQKGEDYIPDLLLFWTKPIPANFDTHFGLMTALGNKWHPSSNALIKRPAFNAFDSLNKMGPVRLVVEGTQFGDPIHALAAKSQNESVQILLYHLREDDYFNENSRNYPAYLKINNLPEGKYRSDMYVIDESRSNGFTLWKSLGRPAKPGKAQLRQLQQNDDLELVETKFESINNERKYEKLINLQNNSVALLILSKVNSVGNLNAAN